MGNLIAWTLLGLLVLILFGIGLAYFTYRESQTHKKRHAKEQRPWQ